MTFLYQQHYIGFSISSIFLSCPARKVGLSCGHSSDGVFFSLKLAGGMEEDFLWKTSPNVPGKPQETYGCFNTLTGLLLSLGLLQLDPSLSAVCKNAGELAQCCSPGE